jgi:hypothetical protein
VEKTIDKVSYKSKLVRVQRLKKYKNCKGIPHSVERSPLHTDRIDPHHHKSRGSISNYQLTRGRTKEEALVDLEMEVRYWHHPAEIITFRT